MQGNRAAQIAKPWLISCETSSGSEKLLRVCVLLLVGAGLASGADRYYASDTGTSFAKFASTVTKARFPVIPFQAERGRYWVAWTQDPQFKGSTVFGSCEPSGDTLTAWFPWGGKEWKNPKTWYLLEDSDYFWGNFDEESGKPDCSEVEGGEPFLIDGFGAVNVNRALLPARVCLPSTNPYVWAVGKWKDKYLWIGCRRKEFRIALKDLKKGEVFFLCTMKASPWKCVEFGRSVFS